MEKKVIEIEIQDNSKTLKQQYKEAVLEVQKLADAFGATSIEVQNASKRAAELKDQIEDVNDAIQAQKGEGAFIALGKSISTVASGFSAVEGAMGLVGAESEDVQKAMLRVQSAMALAQGLEGLEDAGRAFKQLGAVVKSTTVFTSAYNFVMGVSNKETLTNVAVTEADTTAKVGLTGATAGVATVTGGATTAMKLFRLALISTGIGAIVVLVGALIANFDKLVEVGKSVTDFFGITDSKAEKKAENDKRRTNAELKNIERAKKARQRAYDEETGSIDRQIKLLEAQGKSTEALEKLQLKRSLTNQRELIKEARLNLQILRATNIGGVNDEMIEETLTAIAEMKQAILNTETDINIARINNAKETKKEIEKIGLSDEELDSMLNESLKKLSEPIVLPTPEFTDEPIDLSIVDEATHEINNYWAELEDGALKSFEGYKTLLHARMEEELRVTQATGAEAEAIRKKYGDLEIARQNEINKTKLQLTADAFGAIGDLIQSFNAKDEATARKQFKVAKAFNLAAALTNTYLAVTSALATSKELFPGQRFIEAGIAGTTGLAQVAKIASTQFGGGGGGGNPDVPNPSSIIAPNLNVVGNTGINQLATLQQQPVKAYVVSNDITSAQQFDMKVQQTSQL
jgi:enamine deaminase RidA (YjgF/YER057c/UK114 family)